MISIENRTVLHCKCERPSCGHEWDSFRRGRNGQLISEKPTRCARCKFRGWNKEDYRRKDPLENTPPPDPRQPLLRPADTLAVFTRVEGILSQLVADYGPCNHDKQVCVCSETEALAKVKQQIALLQEVTRRKKKTAPAMATAANGKGGKVKA